MNELQPDPNVRPPMTHGKNDLGGILSLINNPELELLGGLSPTMEPIQSTETEEEEVKRPVRPPPPAIHKASTIRPVGASLLLSGRLASGKDYVAAQAGARVFGFADPLYAVASYFFGVEVTATQNKDLPGMRAFLQYLGQWGRGEVNDKYPYTPARAVFVQMVRSLGVHSGSKAFCPSVDWSSFGFDKNIWINALHKRMTEAREIEPKLRVAITNARFENELRYFRDQNNFDHFHIMCSPETWAERLAKKNLKPESKELQDVSEQLAIHLDRDVVNKIRTQKVGNKLKVIWNDHRPCPSARLYTLNEFLQGIAIDEARLPEDDQQ